MNDFKGLFNVTLDGNVLENWTITGFPLSDAQQIEDLIHESDRSNNHTNHRTKFDSDILTDGPVIYHGVFNIDEDNQIYDTYLNPFGWGKVKNDIVAMATLMTHCPVSLLFTGNCVHK